MIGNKPESLKAFQSAAVSQGQLLLSASVSAWSELLVPHPQKRSLADNARASRPV
jgi:hypothetical protein